VADTVTLDAFPAAMAKLTGPPADLGPLLRDVAAACLAASAEALDQSRSPAGAPFALLKPSTLKRRRGPRKPLVGRGSYGPSHRAEVRGQGVVWFSTHPAWPFHQAGTRRMAARRTVEMSPQLLDRIGQLAADYWARAIAGA
jgi:hypothetical protein